jgi:transcriptional regulator with XRE-family HTH domain
MSTLTYSLMDEQMTQDDKVFFKALGKQVANLRKEIGMTQTQLADALGVSQQLIAAYEAGSRKIPASLLPIFSKMFAVSIEQLIGMAKMPSKRGPASRLQQQMEQIAQMPKAKQKLAMDMLEAIIQQQAS